jgi:hypothetical protein
VKYSKEEDGIFFPRTAGRLSRDTTRHQHSLSSAKGAMIYQRRLQSKRRRGKTKYNSDERKCHRQRCALYIGYISCQLKAMPIIRLSNSLFRSTTNKTKAVVRQSRIELRRHLIPNAKIGLIIFDIYQVLSGFHFFLEYSKFWEMQMIRDVRHE